MRNDDEWRRGKHDFVRLGTNNMKLSMELRHERRAIRDGRNDGMVMESNVCELVQQLSFGLIPFWLWVTILDLSTDLGC